MRAKWDENKIEIISLLYGFRVRAIGSAGLGIWTSETTERAP
jgi:hypothetical protein